RRSRASTRIKPPRRPARSVRTLRRRCAAGPMARRARWTRIAVSRCTASPTRRADTSSTDDRLQTRTSASTATAVYLPCTARVAPVQVDWRKSATSAPLAHTAPGEGALHARLALCSVFDHGDRVLFHGRELRGRRAPRWLEDHHRKRRRLRERAADRERR